MFFSGMAGSGVSALALFMALRGHSVSGSDRQFDSGNAGELRARLAAAGINIYPQDGSGITRDIDLMVISTAVEKDRPEITRAAGLGIRVMTRPEFLASLSEGFRSMAVAGTSGKSTASGMLAYALRRLGADPNFISGGRAKDLRTATNPGNVLSGASDWLVMEADESDGSIVMYRPSMSVISNLSLDHNPVDETAGMFHELIRNTSGTVVLNADDPAVMAMDTGSALKYSIAAPSDLRAEGLVFEGTGSRFSIHGREFRLRQPGEHNVQNALSAIAIMHSMGYGLAEISEALGPFGGIERRFDVHLDLSGQGGPMVIDDYAHNPHKIAALMRTISGLSGRACYIFQPHGFGPLRLMLDEYAGTFNALLRPQDRLFILPVYYTGGTVSRDISSADLAALCRASTLITRDALLDYISGMKGFESFVVLGARDETLSNLAGRIAALISPVVAADER